MSEIISIVGIGEVLWDMLPTGPQLGGAPANFTFHAQSLGANALLVSRVGNDALGKETLKRLRELGVETKCIGIDERHPTGTVTVRLESGQPHYVIHEDVAWDFIEAPQNALEAAKRANAICFGTLAQRSDVSRKSIRELVSASARNALRVCDINLRQHYFSRELLKDSLELANVLKLNDAELPVVADLFGIRGNTHEQIKALTNRFELKLVVLTQGERGSILFDGMNWSEQPGQNVQIKDTIGAGDSFTAATVLGLLRGWPLERINKFANEVAAFVCSHQGATPLLPDRFRQELQPSTSYA